MLWRIEGFEVYGADPYNAAAGPAFQVGDKNDINLAIDEAIAAVESL